MAANDVPSELRRLVQKMEDQYRESEMDIATALAEADGPLTVEELVEATGYTQRTVKKRVDTLTEQLRGEPLIRRDDDVVELHPAVADAIRRETAEA